MVQEIQNVNFQTARLYWQFYCFTPIYEQYTQHAKVKSDLHNRLDISTSSYIRKAIILHKTLDLIIV